MDAATIKGVVDRLKLRGLMRAKPDPEDGRMRLISLTPAGRRLADRVIPAATEITRRTLAPLGDAEQAVLLDLLRRLTGVSVGADAGPGWRPIQTTPPGSVSNCILRACS
jgi:DNA-binding MarR family transcriptional regulator